MKGSARRPVVLLVALLMRCAEDVSAVPAEGGIDAPVVERVEPVVEDLPVEVRDPCRASDQDEDGFGTDPSCVERDCDDRNVAIHPGAPEACNGIDDDCDGSVDEGLGEGSCGVGACRRTAPYCVAGRPARCVPGPPAEESCNGIDDDCDGRVDEDVTGGEPCGVGACRRRARCVGGRLEDCVPGAPGEESCNGIDDDCDGTVDEGFRAADVTTSYGALRARHEGCDGARARIGPDCNAAMHRFCAARACASSGFGPTENSGDTALVGCVQAEPSRTVPYAVLATHHGGCNGTTQRIGQDCNAAIHRYCAASGYVSGFGPVELGPTTAAVTCLRAGAATVVETQYTVLAGHHPGCTAAVRIGQECNAAIRRFCRARGFEAGYGPVENSGNTAVVTCVAR